MSGNYRKVTSGMTTVDMWEVELNPDGYETKADARFFDRRTAEEWTYKRFVSYGHDADEIDIKETNLKRGKKTNIDVVFSDGAETLAIVSEEKIWLEEPEELP